MESIVQMAHANLMALSQGDQRFADWRLAAQTR
jgi:hypothetical protein